MKISALNPFRFRNLLVGVLALGLLIGVWLGDLFKGFGWGPGPGGGTGSGKGSSPNASSTQSPRTTSDGSADLAGHQVERDPESLPDVNAGSGGIVKVLIDDRNYYLRHGGKKQPIRLDALVRLIEQTEPDEDGLRAIVDRTPSSRASAEVKLFDSLKDAGISANSVYLAPNALE